MRRSPLETTVFRAPPQDVGEKMPEALFKEYDHKISSTSYRSFLIEAPFLAAQALKDSF